MKKNPEIFLSYAREDRSRVEAIYDSLRAEGFQPWMDTRDIMAGEKWSSVIGTAIRKADFVLVFISGNSISKRGYVQREIQAALSILSERPEGEIFLIPVRLDDSALPNALSHIQFVDVFDEEGWRRLLDVLRRGQQRGDLPPEGISTLKEEVQREEQAESSEGKPHIFVAMPFKVEMEDIYHYGIRQAVDANGFTCERVDKTAFMGCGRLVGNGGLLLPKENVLALLVIRAIPREPTEYYSNLIGRFKGVGRYFLSLSSGNVTHTSKGVHFESSFAGQPPSVEFLHTSIA